MALIDRKIEAAAIVGHRVVDRPDTASNQAETVKGWFDDLVVNFVIPTINGMIEDAHPVGSIYMSTDNANPSTLFGGTWAAWGEGKIPVGVKSTDVTIDAAEKTRGSNTKTIAQANLPNVALDVSTGSGFKLTVSSGATGGMMQIPFSATTGEAAGGTGQVKASLGGSGTALDVIPEEIACYMWKRTA